MSHQPNKRQRANEWQAKYGRRKSVAEQLRDLEKKQADEDAEGDKFLATLQTKYKAKKLTNFQFRVEDTIDIYPTNFKYHILSTGKRGNYNPPTLDFIASILTK